MSVLSWEYRKQEESKQEDQEACLHCWSNFLQKKQSNKLIIPLFPVDYGGHPRNQWFSAHERVKMQYDDRKMTCKEMAIHLLFDVVNTWFTTDYLPFVSLFM